MSRRVKKALKKPRTRRREVEKLRKSNSVRGVQRRRAIREGHPLQPHMRKKRKKKGKKKK